MTIIKFLHSLVPYVDRKIADYYNRPKAKYYKLLLEAYCESVGTNLVVEGRPELSGSGKILIGDDVKIRGSIRIVATTHIFGECAVIIGDRTHIGRHSEIRSARSVKIGHDCLIARYVRIFDYNGHPMNPEMRLKYLPCPKQEVTPIEIGNNVWIGENAIIAPGVSIGENSIVAANSLVTKHVPPNTLVVGVPARVTYWLDKMKKQ